MLREKYVKLHNLVNFGKFFSSGLTILSTKKKALQKKRDPEPDRNYVRWSKKVMHRRDNEGT